MSKLSFQRHSTSYACSTAVSIHKEQSKISVHVASWMGLCNTQLQMSNRRSRSLHLDSEELIEAIADESSQSHQGKGEHEDVSTEQTNGSSRGNWSRMSIASGVVSSFRYTSSCPTMMMPPALPKQWQPPSVSTLLDDEGGHTQPSQRYTLNRLLVLVRLTRRSRSLSIR